MYPSIPISDRHGGTFHNCHAIENVHGLIAKMIGAVQLGTWNVTEKAISGSLQPIHLHVPHWNVSNYSKKKVQTELASYREGPR